MDREEEDGGGGGGDAEIATERSAGVGTRASGGKGSMTRDGRHTRLSQDSKKRNPDHPPISSAASGQDWRTPSWPGPPSDYPRRSTWPASPPRARQRLAIARLSRGRTTTPPAARVETIGQPASEPASEPATARQNKTKNTRNKQRRSKEGNGAMIGDASD